MSTPLAVLLARVRAAPPPFGPTPAAPRLGMLLGRVREARPAPVFWFRARQWTRIGPSIDFGTVRGEPEQAVREALARRRWSDRLVRVDLLPEPRGSGPTLHFDVDYPSLEVRPRAFTPVVLVSCSKVKRRRPGRAEDVYASPLFREQLAYARTLVPDERIRILSTRHGVLALGERIAPYDATLKEMSKREREAWGSRVVGSLRATFRELGPLKLIVLAGKEYVRSIGPVDDEGWAIEVPLRRLEVGERRAWLKEHTPPSRRPGGAAAARRRPPRPVACEACGESWPRDPALEVACPTCQARIGAWCRRPSRHRAAQLHRDREQRAIDVGKLSRCPEGTHGGVGRYFSEPDRGGRVRLPIPGSHDTITTRLAAAELVRRELVALAAVARATVEAPDGTDGNSVSVVIEGHDRSRGWPGLARIHVEGGDEHPVSITVGGSVDRATEAAFHEAVRRALAGRRIVERPAYPTSEREQEDPMTTPKKKVTPKRTPKPRAKVVGSFGRLMPPEPDVTRVFLLVDLVGPPEKCRLAMSDVAQSALESSIDAYVEMHPREGFDEVEVLEVVADHDAGTPADPAWSR